MTTSLYPDSLDNPNNFETPSDQRTTDMAKALQATHQRQALSQTSVSPSTGNTVTPDMSLGSMLAINMPATLTPSITVANPTNARDADTLTLVITQGSLGLGTVTWGSEYRKSLTLSVGAGARDVITFRYHDADTTWYQVATQLGL